jgi:class 3 adenylate cyclase
VPAQTRGFLFSDLRGYSAYTERHGDRGARELLTRYRRIVREAIASFGGAEIRTEGDSFYIVFDSVSDAVEAGLAILTGLAQAETANGESIAAGVGVHAGEVEDDAEQGIVSSAVNIAARICAAAAPGELLVSDTVRSLTRGYLDVSFLPRGRKRLKGIRDPVAVYRVVTGPTAGEGHRLLRISVALATVVVVAAGLVVVPMLLDDTMGGPRAPADGTQAASPHRLTAAPSTTALGSPPPSSDGAFPDAEEADLLGRLPSGIASRCLRADADEIPEAPPRAGQQIPLLVTAAVRCPVTTNVNAYFFAGSGPTAVQETLFYIAGRRGLSEPCDPAGPGLEQWAFGPASGWVLCGRDSYWTYEGSNLLGRAIGPTLELTMEWWRDNARFPAD